MGGFLRGARPAVGARFSIVPQAPDFVKSFCENSFFFFFLKPIDRMSAVCYN